jgi:hypothetical protein
MLVTMGNIVPGNADTITITMYDYTTEAFPNPPGPDVCNADVTVTPGTNIAGVAGVKTIAVPFSSFVCGPGTLAGLQAAGVTNIGFAFNGAKNSAIVSGETDTLAVGSIGFTYCETTTGNSCKGL